MAATIAGGSLVENFDTLDFADLQSSTGVWNIVDKRAQSAAFANAAIDPNRVITFGNGTDGALFSANGFNFDTDSHPNGYQFTSVNITAGAISVTGSNALVIRSLTTVNIVPTIPVFKLVGANNGAAGSAAGTTTVPGSAVTCGGNGGKGGTGGSAGLGVGNVNNGLNGFLSSGALDLGHAGTGQFTGAYNGSVDATASAALISSDFDASFDCGPGGAGGGGYSFAAVGPFASGGAGGAGGGRLHITAIGNITITDASTIGGNGGNGAKVGAAPCSGVGAGGSGGSLWIQTLGTLGANAPILTAGNTGTSFCQAVLSPSVGGLARGDSAPASRPGSWNTGAGSFDTDLVPIATSSVVFSKAYDLSVWNAGFTAAPTVSQTLNGGQITVQYAGSADGTSFNGFVSDITTLSNKNYRYLKFKISITSNAGAVAASPFVNQISLQYNDLGLDSVTFPLAAGCATTHKAGTPSGKVPFDLLAELSLMIMATLFLKRRSNHTSG